MDQLGCLHLRRRQVGDSPVFITCGNHRETIGKMEVLMGKPWENHGKMNVYPLVNCYITMERSTIL
jgi:hypothetical protein